MPLGLDIFESRGRLGYLVAQRNGDGDLQVIERAAAILRLLSVDQLSIQVSDVVDKLQLQRTTAYRYLSSLTAQGFLVRLDETNSYTCGPLLAYLGAVAKSNYRVTSVAPPYMQELAKQTEETVVISLWAGLGAVVSRVQKPSPRVAHVSVTTGSLLELEAAQTKVFLANLKDRELIAGLIATLPNRLRRELAASLEVVAKEGFATWTDDHSGIAAIACPIFDDEGGVCASIALVGTYKSIPKSISEPNGALLAKTALAISEHLKGNIGGSVLGNTEVNYASSG